MYSSKMREKTLPTSSFWVMETNLPGRADGSECCAIQRTMPPPADSPRRIALAVVVTLVLTAAAVPVIAAVASWAFPAPDHRYRARVVCGKDGTPSRFCHRQDVPRAEFVDHFDAKQRYRRCVTKPTGATYCDDLDTAVLADTPIADPLDIDQVGQWRVIWSVKGRPVGDWAFTVAW